MHLVVDSTGLKVYGEGEWKVRHGASGARGEPLGVDEATEIVAQTLSPIAKRMRGRSCWHEIEAPIEALGGDGAMTKQGVQGVGRARAGGTYSSIIPPRKDAKIEQHGNTNAEPLPRDETIRAIRKPFGNR